MEILPDKLLVSILQRMKKIVESPEYSPREKRLRVMAQLERVLEIVMQDLPEERRKLVQEMLVLSERSWSC